MIFSDDFNRPDSTSVGNSWLESENVPTDAAIAGNQLYFADNAANITHQLSLISNPFYDIDVALDVLSGSVLSSYRLTT